MAKVPKSSGKPVADKASKPTASAFKPKQKSVPKNEARAFDPVQMYKNSKGSGIPDYFKCFRPDCPAPIALVQQAWTKGPTVVRPLPYINPADGQSYLPARSAPEDYMFTPWMFQAPAAKMGNGTDSITFLLYDPVEDQNSGGQLAGENPYVLFHNALRQANSKKLLNNAQWIYLFQGEKGKSAALPKPAELAFIQCVVMQSNGECQILQGKKPRGTQEDDYTQILCMNSSPAGILKSQLNERNDAWTGKMTDWKNAYTFGDPVSLKNGKFIAVWGADHPWDFDTEEEQQAYEKYVPAYARSGANAKGYGAQFLSEYVYARNKTVSPDITQYDLNGELHSKLQWWSDVLFYPPAEQQCEMMARLLAGVSDSMGLFRLAWAQYPHLLTSSVLSILKKKKQAVVPDASEGLDEDIDDEDIDDDDIDDDDLPEELEEEVVKPKAKAKAKAKPKAKAKVEVEEEDDEEEDDEEEDDELPEDLEEEDADDDDDIDDDDDELPEELEDSDDDDEDEDEDEEEEEVKPKPKAKAKPKAAAKVEEDEEDDELPEDLEDEDEEDDDDVDSESSDDDDDDEESAESAAAQAAAMKAAEKRAKKRTAPAEQPPFEHEPAAPAKKPKKSAK